MFVVYCCLLLFIWFMFNSHIRFTSMICYNSTFSSICINIFSPCVRNSTKKLVIITTIKKNNFNRIVLLISLIMIFLLILIMDTNNGQEMVPHARGLLTSMEVKMTENMWAKKMSLSYLVALFSLVLSFSKLIFWIFNSYF